MKLLFIILSVMTWTVTSKTKVTSEGDVPASIDAVYTNTYNKGQVRANDTATLTLSHLGGIALEQIEVYVKSNQTSGAGVFVVEADGQPVASKSGTMQEWTGAYDNQFFHPVTLFSGHLAQVQTLTIRLIGTVNSLHIDKYVIAYQPAPTYTVTLMNGAQQINTLTESSGGAGVLLPSMPDANDWLFIGWTETPFYTVYAQPNTLYKASEPYYPSTNGTLWAVYKSKTDQSNALVTNLQSGVYLYVDSHDYSAITGVPENGRMNYADADVNDENQFYQIDFNEACDSATIQHLKTGTYIGFNGVQLAAKQSVWCVYHGGDKTGFYTEYNGKPYILLPAVYHTSNGGETYADLQKVNDVTPTPTALIAAMQELEPTAYTCYPETGKGLESVTDRPDEVIIPIGVYQLHISNGKKSIRL